MRSFDRLQAVFYGQGSLVLFIILSFDDIAILFCIRRGVEEMEEGRNVEDTDPRGRRGRTLLGEPQGRCAGGVTVAATRAVSG